MPLWGASIAAARWPPTSKNLETVQATSATPSSSRSATASRRMGTYRTVSVPSPRRWVPPPERGRHPARRRMSIIALLTREIDLERSGSRAYSSSRPTWSTRERGRAFPTRSAPGRSLSTRSRPTFATLRSRHQTRRSSRVPLPYRPGGHAPGEAGRPVLAIECDARRITPAPRARPRSASQAHLQRLAALPPHLSTDWFYAVSRRLSVPSPPTRKPFTCRPDGRRRPRPRRRAAPARRRAAVAPRRTPRGRGRALLSAIRSITTATTICVSLPSGSPRRPVANRRGADPRDLRRLPFERSQPHSRTSGRHRPGGRTRESTAVIRPP